MGLPKDMPSHVGYSVFVDFGGSERATLHDYVLLAMLYDPRIRIGMREPEIEEVVPDVLVAAKAHVLRLWHAAP